jgi:hypothetical protein
MRVLLAILAVSTSFVRPALAESRVDTLVNTLRVMCMVEPLNFERLDQKATAMDLRVLTNFAPPEVNGLSIRSKTWLMEVSGGPLALSASDAMGGPRPLTMCGFAAPNVTVGEMQAALTTALGIGQPRTVSGQDGHAGLMVRWDHLQGDMTLTLMTRRFKPEPGFTLIYEGQVQPSAK